VFRFFRLARALVALLFLSAPALAQQQPRLKVFISVDMEGLAGVVAAAEVRTDGPDYAHFRAIMAGETNAAIEGAFRAGATEVIGAESMRREFSWRVPALSRR
jgi:D-amino peptidase